MNIKSTQAYKSFRLSGKNIRKHIKRYFFRKKLNKKTPVFIFQMGKVASSSIFSSLTEQYSGAVAHAHHIGDENWMSMEFKKLSIDNKPIKIISLIREPISRNVSDFFQLFEDFVGVTFNESTYTTNELKEKFLLNYTHELPLEWFDENINKHFDIDVYSSPFPAEGHIEFSRNNVDLLIMRYDLVDTKKESLINEFLNINAFKINRSNISSVKNYYQTYKDFQTNVDLPDEYLDKMCGSKYFNHFFPEKEINDVRSKWTIKK